MFESDTRAVFVERLVELLSTRDSLRALLGESELELTELSQQISEYLKEKGCLQAALERQQLELAVLRPMKKRFEEQELELPAWRSHQGQRSLTQPQ